MTAAPDTIRIVIPLKLRRRNGRPRIMPSADDAPTEPEPADARLLRAIARAWGWRRKLESGEAATIGDIAVAENISDRFVARRLRLAWLAPQVLEALVVERWPCALTIDALAEVAQEPWAVQTEPVFEEWPHSQHPS